MAVWRTKDDLLRCCDGGRPDKRVIGIMAAILASLHMQTADDLFGGPQGVNRIRLMSGIRELR